MASTECRAVLEKLFEEPQQATQDIRALVAAREAAAEGLPASLDPRSRVRLVRVVVGGTTRAVGGVCQGRKGRSSAAVRDGGFRADDLHAVAAVGEADVQ